MSPTRAPECGPQHSLRRIETDVQPERMNGGELRTVREYLGLTGYIFAQFLSVPPRTLRAWEAGEEPIPLPGTHRG